MRGALAALLLALVRVDSQAPPSTGLAVGYDDLTDGLHHFMDTQAPDTTLPCETTHHEVFHSETGTVEWANLNGLGPDTNASQRFAREPCRDNGRWQTNQHAARGG